MALLTVHNLTKYFGDRCLFSGVGFEIGERDKIGLVGDNGSGKTTLLRILTGEYSSDGGGAAFSRDTRLGYMEQHTGIDAQCTLWEQAEKVFANVIELEKEWASVNRRLAGSESGDADLIERQHTLTEQIEAAGGLTYKSRIRATLLGLGFDEAAFSQSVSSLSGGQKSKAAMASLLLSDTNLLFLDEPTNHLDIQSVEWLEEFLHSYVGAAVIISHDRYFLDRVTTRTFELANNKFYSSNGNYSAHKALREKQREVDEKHYKNSMREIQRVEGIITQLKQFNREKSIRAAESKEKMLERMKTGLETPENDAPVIRFDFSARVTGGNEVLSAEKLAMEFPERPLFENVSFDIRRGERIFLLGPNGCGKTTLLKILNGKLTPKTGKVRLGAKVSAGYYDQTQSELNHSKTVMDEVWDAYPDRTQTELRCALAAFLFRGDDVFKPVSMLSGGERARLMLLKLMLSRDNLLLLDEPTNHLDIASCEALEDALSGYDGTLFIVSHDRYFINRMATRVLYLDRSGCRSYIGSYDDYINEFRRQEQQYVAPARAGKPASPKVSDYKRRKEQEGERRRLKGRIKRTEEDVTAAEDEIKAIHEQLSDEQTASDYSLIMQLTTQLDSKNTELECLMEEWEKLQSQLQMAEGSFDKNPESDD